MNGAQQLLLFFCLLKGIANLTNHFSDGVLVNLLSLSPSIHSHAKIIIEPKNTHTANKQTNKQKNATLQPTLTSVICIHLISHTLTQN
jgi:hypothetical protein